MSSTHVIGFELFCQRQVARIKAVNQMTYGPRRPRRKPYNADELIDRRDLHNLKIVAWRLYQGTDV